MNNSIPLHLHEVLDKKRLSLLENLKDIKDMGCILGGGTALALMFGHRESIDFDFFIGDDIDTEILFHKCQEIFFWKNIQKIHEEKNTLYIIVNEVKISFFTYIHAAVSPLIESEYFMLYSIEDIGTMKLWAIQNRATNKDYVDLYYIIQKLWLKALISCFFDKFWQVVTESYLLKSLIYFDDILEEPLILHSHEINFEKVKTFLEEQVAKY